MAALKVQREIKIESGMASPLLKSPGLEFTGFQRLGPDHSRVPVKEHPTKNGSLPKLQTAFSKKLVFNYDFKIRKGKFVAKFHPWKRLRF